MRQVGALAALLAFTVGAQAADVGQRSAGGVELPSRAEFPDFDASAYRLLQQGLAAKEAARRLIQSPDDPALVRVLVERERFDDALRVLRGIVGRQPARIADAFGGLPVHPFQRDTTTSYASELREVVSAARKRISELPREPQATAARALLSVENQIDRGGSGGWATRLAAFVSEYAGTSAALLAEVELIRLGRLSPATLDALDAFRARHPGTEAAARALHQKGSDLANNASALRIEPRGADPTPRFLQVIDIVRELESGAYPDCEWVRNAPQLVVGFYASRPVSFSTPANLDAMLRGYAGFVRSHFALDEGSIADNGIGYVVTSRMADLFEQRGERIAGVERFLAELEREVAEPAAVRLLRAAFYIRNLFTPSVDRELVWSKAVTALETVHREAPEPFARRALATLASLYFHDRRYSEARDVYRAYLQRYPDRGWAWLAALRLGQSLVETSDIAGAVAAWRQAAGAHAALPIVQVVANAWLSDALASLGRVDEALGSAERALAAWDDDFGIEYRTQAIQARGPADQPFAIPDDTTVVKVALPHRIAQLRRSASHPAGASVERGRWLLARGRVAEASPILEAAVAAARGTAFETEARSLSHRARLEQALGLADVENPKRDGEAALAQLAELAAQPTDFHVVAAGLARATLRSALGDAAEADARMTEALNRWVTQQPTAAAPAPGSIEADVLAIRVEVFRPLGGGVFARTKWNAFDFPPQLPKFLVVNPDLSVKRAGAAAPVRLTLRQPIPGLPNVLFLDGDQLAVLGVVMKALGGTGRRAPTQIMQTPNQPAGPSLDVRAFWNRYFPTRPGHWAGWVFETFPIITDVTFQDEARTRAAVRVTVGYAGGTVVLVKEQGAWQAREIVNLWIT